MQQPEQHVANVVRSLLRTGAFRATKFLNESATIRATQLGRPRKNARARSVLVTFGSPNYAERRFIRRCKAAGEPFPVKKIQLKFKA